MGGLSSSAVQSSLCLWAHQGLSWAQFLFVHENCANPTFPSAQFYLREWIELKNKQTNKQKPKPPPPPQKNSKTKKAWAMRREGGWANGLDHVPSAILSLFFPLSPQVAGLGPHQHRCRRRPAGMERGPAGSTSGKRISLPVPDPSPSLTPLP